MTGSRRRDENSGLIDLDALLKEASDPQLPRADDSLEGIATPAPPEPEPPPRAEPASGSRTKAVEPIAVIKSVPPPPASIPPEPPKPVVAVAPAPPPERKAAPKRRSFPVLLVAIFAVAAVVTFLVFRGPRATTDASARPADPPPRATPVATSAATAIAEPSEGTLDAKDLPAAASASASAAPSAHATPASPHPSSSATAKVTTVALPDAPGGERGDLGGAMRDAVGSRDQAEAPPAETTTAPGARQLRPSPGAVVGAINSVLPAARECLGPDDPVRSATIVFKSDGTVARVDMSGERPTDGCVRAALSRARVAPFVDDTFAARATVRP